MASIALALAGGQKSESLVRHLTTLANGTTPKILNEAIEQLVRPAGVEAAEARVGRTGLQDDIIGAAKIIVVEVWRRGLVAEDIANDLKAAGVDGADDLSKMVYSAVRTRHNEIGRALSRKMTEISSGTLEDFDWSLRLCMGSDQLATLRRPLLLLSLTIRKPNGKVEKKTLELSRKELDDLLSSFGDIATCIGKLI